MNQNNNDKKIKFNHLMQIIHHGICDNFHNLVITSGSVIAEHVINNWVCAMSFTKDFFTINNRVHSNYHLRILETYIRSRQISLCKKKWLLGLNIIGVCLTFSPVDSLAVINLCFFVFLNIVYTIYTFVLDWL